VTNLVRPSEGPRSTAPSPGLSLRPTASPGRDQRTP